MYLRPNELRSYSEFIHSLYLPQTEESLRQTIARGIIKIIPGENAGVCAFDMRAQRITSEVSSHKHLLPTFAEAFTQFIPHHPLFATLKAPPIPGGSVLSDHSTKSQWYRNACYNEVFRPEGIDDQLSIEIDRPSPHLNPNGIGIFRKSMGFNRKDRWLMRMLHSHIKQAYDNVSQGDIPTILLALEAQPTTTLAEGLILLDHNKQIIHCSESTREALAFFFSTETYKGTSLPLEIDKLLKPFSPRSFTKTIKSETLKIRIYQDAVGRYLLTVRTEGPASFSARLNSRGLTLREAEVLYWLAQGKRNEEIAIILGISFFTVKNHLRRIFSVLGVETRTAALAAAIHYL